MRIDAGNKLTKELTEHKIWWESLSVEEKDILGNIKRLVEASEKSIVEEILLIIGSI